jgi:NitT/TauT family transport system permease protein
VHAWQLYVTDHSVYGDFARSMIEAGVGFGISLAGIPLGLLIGLSKRVQTAMEPINSAMYALPHISLVPLAIVWFGLGITSKAFIVFISAFFLIMINVTAGVATIGRELRDVPFTFGASRWRMFWTLIVPGSVPFIMVALQLAIGRALVGVVAAELFASNKGLGYLLSIFGNNFETANLFVIIATFALVGAIMSVLVGFLARRFEKWLVE